MPFIRSTIHWGKSAFYLLQMTILDFLYSSLLHILPFSLPNVLHIDPTDGKRFCSFQIRIARSQQHSRFDSCSNMHLLSIIEALLRGAIRNP